MNQKITLFLILCSFFFYPSIDPDLGWHLRYGEFVLANQKLLANNTFASTLPEYQWINHSWGYDILATILFKMGSFTAHSVVASLLLAATSFFVTTSNKNIFQRILAITIMTLFSLPLINMGLRSQILSLGFAAVLFWLLEKQKYIYLPILFAIWANIHGQFLLGLGIACIYLLAQLYQSQLSLKRTAIYIGTSLLATLINPYGYKLHLDIFNSYVYNPDLSMITEWQPWPFMSLGFIGLTLYIIATLYAALVQRHWTRVITWGVLAILALQSRRIIPWYLLFTVGSSVEYYWSTLPPQMKKISTPINVILICMYVFLSFSQFPRTINQTWDSYCQSVIGCSENSVKFLNEHPPQKLWNAYKLGGHLIYRLPEFPVAYDGRMTTWQSGNVYPMREYAQIIQAQGNYQEKLIQGKYDVIIVNHEYPLNSALTAARWPVVFADQTLKIFHNPHL